jgi:hypothetical protein
MRGGTLVSVDLPDFLLLENGCRGFLASHGFIIAVAHCGPIGTFMGTDVTYVPLENWDLFGNDIALGIPRID